MIYFQYSECKGSYTIYYINFTLLFVVIRCLKKELVINFLILNDIFDCDFIGTLTSLSNKTFLFH